MNEQEKVEKEKTAQEELTRTILSQVRDQDLLAFANLQKIHLPPHATKKQIIEILIESPPNGFSSFLGNAFRLELRSTESNILELINQKAVDLATTAQKSIDSAMKGVDVVKWLLTGTAAALGIIVAALGVSSTRKISEFSTEIKQAEESRKAMEALQQQSASVLAIYRQHMINQWIEGIDAVMETFSSSLPDDKLLNDFLTYHDSIGKMVTLSKPNQNANDETVLTRITAICNALRGVRELKDAKTDDWDTKAMESERLWLEIGAITSSPADPNAPFLKRSNAFRSNALGIIYLKRYSKSKDAAHLKTADDYFKEAVAQHPTFGRAFSSHAIVYSSMFDRPENKKRRRELISTAISLQKRGNDYPERTGSGRSRTLNNIAAYLLREARLDEEDGQLGDIESKLREADQAIANAQEQDSFVPTVYVTEAEVASFRLHRNTAANDAEGKRILELVKRAVSRHYNFVGDKTSLPFFELIRERYPTVVGDIYTALGLCISHGNSPCDVCKKK